MGRIFRLQPIARVVIAGRLDPETAGSGGAADAPGRDRRVPWVDADANRAAAFLHPAAQGFAARRYRRATRGGATILRGALWTHIGAGACTRWRCGCHRWVHGRWHRVRCGNWRVCTRLSRPDRTRLERISGRNQGRTNRGPGAVDAEKREHAPEEPEVSAFATLSRHSSSQAGCQRDRSWTRL